MLSTGLVLNDDKKKKKHSTKTEYSMWCCHGSVSWLHIRGVAYCYKQPVIYVVAERQKVNSSQLSQVSLLFESAARFTSPYSGARRW